jgi:hypothetical protein
LKETLPFLETLHDPVENGKNWDENPGYDAFAIILIESWLIERA